MSVFALQLWVILFYNKHVYKELVIDGTLNSDSMLVMGAWKTGYLVNDFQGDDYIDSQGTRFSFKHGWRSAAMAHYNGWKFIQNNFDVLKEKIPNTFPDVQPEIIETLVKQPDIGFIFATFFLHCCKPREYPLFDQHVYRAYKYEETGENEIEENSANRWEAYCEYKKFFDALVINSKCEPYKVDRALWAYGKSLKHQRTSIKAVSKSSDKKKQEKIYIEEHKSDIPWKCISTLARNINNIKYRKAANEYEVIWNNTAFNIKQLDIDLIMRDYFQINKNWYLLGASETDPTPNGLGEYLNTKFRNYTPRHASAIAAILVDLNLLEVKGKRTIWLQKIENIEK